MMIQEFEELTGIEVNMKEYEVIEQMYYDFNGDKQAFCKKFVKDNMMVKVLREVAEGLEGTLMTTETKLNAVTEQKEQLDREIEQLRMKLEREQEWKPWVDEKAVSQEKYDALRNDSTSHEMTDEEAIKWIADEWGFDPAKIRINHEMKTFEINRHGQLRQVGKKWRNPWYDATDWYYVFFTVCGMEYESYSGSLIQL